MNGSQKNAEIKAVRLWKDFEGVRETLIQSFPHPEITLLLDLERNKTFCYVKKGVATTSSYPIHSNK